MQIRSFGQSDIGKRREKNEDAYLINDERNIYLIADGMGGHLGGEFASHLAVKTIEEIFKTLEDDPEATLPEGGGLKPGDYAGSLRYAISVASRRIYEKAQEDPTLRGMGTTTVALVFRNNKAYIANVGDSRVYQIRGKKIIQVTKDHSLVGEQIRAGLLSADDTRAQRLKNIITRSVGFQEDVDSDIDIRVVKKGDRYLLCSDGLSNMVEDEEIHDIVINNGLQDAARRLIDIANERGGDDNITLIIIEVLALDPPAGRNISEESTIDIG
jgi:protein phosphatase